MEKLLTSTQIASLVGVTNKTILRWYLFADNGGELATGETLPERKIVKQGKNTINYWKPEDAEQLIAFKKALPKGRAGVIPTIVSKKD